MSVSEASKSRLVGEVIYLFAFDIAHEMSREPIPSLFGQPMKPFVLDATRHSPKTAVFYRPQMAVLPTQSRIGPRGRVQVQRSIKVLPIGAVSIRVRVPFEVDRMEDLIDFHDIELDGVSLSLEVLALAESARTELKPYILKNCLRVSDEEAYTVFCLHGSVGSELGGSQRAEVWLNSHRHTVAALLTQESELTRLSRQEALESTHLSLSYYEDDLVVVDWDAALVIDDPKDLESTLYVMELGNLQLAELEAYDRVLDGVLERTYRDLRGNPLRRRGEVLKELRELRIDLARFREEFLNLSKFFGDWHLARVYESVASRFHLADWQRAVDDKLRTVGELHEMLKSDHGNRWMMILEIMIVLLFIIDLIMLFQGVRK